MVLGFVFIFSGILLMVFTIEIILRLNKNAKRVKDPEIDKITNLHHIKHWVEPGKIVFAFHFPLSAVMETKFRRKKPYLDH